MKAIYIVLISFLFLIAMSPGKDPCADVKKVEDKFSDKITYQSPFNKQITFTKVIKDSLSFYYISVSKIGSGLDYTGKGLYINLDNGEKLKWKETIVDVDISGDFYIYSAFVGLTNDEIDKLKDNLITDVRVYKFDSTISKRKAEKYKAYMNCLVDKE